jgi:hypothetical protein
MRDLVGHDHQPTSFSSICGSVTKQPVAAASGSPSATKPSRTQRASGVSKTAAQTSVRWLVRRKLIEVKRNSPTAVPTYRVLRPWLD